MNSLKKSRGSQLDIQVLEEKSFNRYYLIIQAAQRAYQIKRGAASKYSTGLASDSAAVTALLEIQND